MYLPVLGPLLSKKVTRYVTVTSPTKVTVIVTATQGKKVTRYHYSYYEK